MPPTSPKCFHGSPYRRRGQGPAVTVGRLSAARRTLTSDHEPDENFPPGKARSDSVPNVNVSCIFVAYATLGDENAIQNSIFGLQPKELTQCWLDEALGRETGFLWR